MSRTQELDLYLSSELYNRKCFPSNVISILENCEKLIINTVFEEKHGEKLYLDHVVEHLQSLSIENGVEDSEEIVKMLEMITAFKQYIKDIKKGCKGERYARKALEKLIIPSHIIDNIQLSYNDVTTEDDLIVVNENGLFIIEVKYSDKNMCITKDGFYVPADDRYVSLGTRNVLEQVSNERYVISNILSKKLNILDTKTLNQKIHSIVLFANRDRRLFDESRSGNVLYCYNVASYISNYDNGIKLTDEEINSYINVLKDSQEQTEYQIDFDLDALRNCIVNGMSLLDEKMTYVVDNTCEEIEDIIEKSDSKSQWNFDWKSALLGAGGAFGAIGLYAVCEHYGFKFKFSTN